MLIYHRKNTKHKNHSYIRNQKKIISEKIKIEKNQIFLLDHHLCHIYTVLYGFTRLNKDYLIFSLDGEGDGLCAKICKYENNKLSELSKTIAGNSLAGFYGAVTKFLNMKINEHEYKVMGLAAYQDKSKYNNEIIKKLQNLFTINENLEFISKGGLNYFIWYLNKYFRYERFDNISFAAQFVVEELAIEWIKKTIKKFKIKNICLTGGFFMNIKVNKRINELNEVNNLVVCPSGGDESVSIGAAYEGYRMSNLDFANNLKMINSLYLGYEINIKKELKINNSIIKSKLITHKFNNFKSKNKKIAFLLNNGEVVARVNGKMEFGARALGNRSILANPKDIGVLHEINKMIKKRDFWMPFACSILDTHKNKYFKDYKNCELKYMEISCETTTKGKKNLKAAIHPFDHTARPQILYKIDNYEYYDLVEQFKNLSGVGGVLNTSFNIHGEPVVMNMQDSFHSFLNSGLKFIAIGNFLFEKR